MARNTIVIQSKHLVVPFVTVAAVLLVGHVSVSLVHLATGHARLAGLNHLFNLADEGNLPTYFSAVLLAIASGLLLIISRLKYSSADKYRFHWAGLALIFLFLSMDEMLELHEQLSAPVQRMLNVLPGNLEYWGWTLPYSILVLVFALSYLAFFFHLSRRFRIYFFLSAFLFVLGALGFEVAEGLYAAARHLQAGEMRGFLPELAMITLEELLEMGGIILFNYTLVEYMKSLPFKVNVEFG